MTLTPTGKPRRALQALKDTTPDTAMTEQQVWSAADQKGDYYAALATLVKDGLAAEVKHPGPARWYITDAGTALLAEQEGR